LVLFKDMKLLVVSKTIEWRNHQKKIQESADKEGTIDSGKEYALGTINTQ
jgi:hypothetical protein